MEWIPIRYREFYDVPRVFALESSGEWMLFDCPLDESADEYHQDYTVYLLDAAAAASLDGRAWPAPERDGQVPIATVPVSTVTFDSTRRKAVRRELLTAVKALVDAS